MPVNDILNENGLCKGVVEGNEQSDCIYYNPNEVGDCIYREKAICNLNCNEGWEDE